MQIDRIKKYDWVDALRGYAILLVIMVHTGYIFDGKTFHFGKITDLGGLGVPLFFIVSCFTLFNSYKSRTAIEKENTNTFFFIRRLFRIAPLYYLAGIFYILIICFYHTRWFHLPLNPIRIAANFTFLNGIYLPAINYLPPGGWSVGDEMLFYLTIPFLFAKIKSFKSSVLFLIGAIVTSFFIQWVMYFIITRYTHYGWTDLRGWFLYFWLPNQFPVFCFGICLYFAITTGKMVYKEWMLLLPVIMFVLFSFINYQVTFPQCLIQKEYLYSIAFCLFAFSLSNTKLEFLVKPVNKIGKVSFSMYLLHFFILEHVSNLFNRFFDSQNRLNTDVKFVIVFVLTIIVTYFVAKLTYKYIEKAGIAAGERIITKIKNRRLNKNIHPVLTD